jgi:hypothetical protein
MILALPPNDAEIDLLQIYITVGYRICKTTFGRTLLKASAFLTLLKDS